ncbi:hypothetical protein RYX36_033257 [Vicia faba]
MKKNVGSRLPFFTSRESNLVKGSIDFLGVNFYNTFYIKDNPGSLQKKNRDHMEDMAAEIKPYSGNGTYTYEVKLEYEHYGYFYFLSIKASIDSTH